MNNSELPNSSNDNGQYHATYNLNTAMENPQGDFNDAMNINIVGTDSNFNSDNSLGSFQNNPQERVSSQDGIQNSTYQYSGDMSSSQDTQFDSRTFTNLNTGDSSLINNNLNQVDSYQSNNFQNDEGNTTNAFIPNADQVDGNVVASQEYDNSNYSSETTYAPVMEKKQAPNKIKISLSKEITFMFVIVLVLVLFLLLMPYIYDFFRNLSFGLI